MNALYTLSIVYYTQFMSQIYNFTVKFDSTTRADYRLLLSHVSDILFLINDTSILQLDGMNINESSLHYTFVQFSVGQKSYYVKSLLVNK